MSETELNKIDCDGLPSPDEFWSEEQLVQWKKDYEAVERLNEKQQTDPPIYTEDDKLEIKKNFPNWGSESGPF